MLQLPLHEYMVDDAYIHLTFAQNLVNGYGFSFNPNEPTFGVTAPLWTMLLYLLGSIFQPTPLLAKCLSIFFGVLTIPILYQLCRKLSLRNNYALSVAILWSVNIWHIRWAASGMETSLALLLLLLGFSAHISRRWYTGLLFGLAVLTRPEVGVLVLVLILELAYSRVWKKALVFCMAFGVTILPWLIYAMQEFGTIYPNPALVKAQSNSFIWSDFVYGFKRIILILGGAHTLEIILLIFGIGWLWRQKSELSRSWQPFYVILIIWMMFPAIFYLSRGVFITSRYMIIGIPPLVICAFLVLQSIKEYGIGVTINQHLKYLVVIMIAIQITLTTIITLPHAAAFQPTIKALKELALELRESTPQGSSVAIGDVGVVGYYADRYLIDLEGLVSPQVIPYRVGKPLEQVIFTEEYWNFRKPDFIIDKAMDSERLNRHFGDRYLILTVKPIPGGMVDTSKEQWYYTLYKIN